MGKITLVLIVALNLNLISSIREIKQKNMR